MISLLMFFAQRTISITVFLNFALNQATFDSKCSCQVSITNILDSYVGSLNRVCGVLSLDQDQLSFSSNYHMVPDLARDQIIGTTVN